jgi:hypothetical protein
VEPPDELALLLELAAEAGMRVRAAPSAGLLESGVCRVKDELWLVLVPSDPVEHRIRVVAGALRTHAPALLDSRWLPPALRARLEAL